MDHIVRHPPLKGCQECLGARRYCNINCNLPKKKIKNTISGGVRLFRDFGYCNIHYKNNHVGGGRHPPHMARINPESTQNQASVTLRNPDSTQNQAGVCYNKRRVPLFRESSMRLYQQNPAKPSKAQQNQAKPSKTQQNPAKPSKTQ